MAKILLDGQGGVASGELYMDTTGLCTGTCQVLQIYQWPAGTNGVDFHQGSKWPQPQIWENSKRDEGQHHHSKGFRQDGRRAKQESQEIKQVLDLKRMHLNCAAIQRDFNRLKKMGCQESQAPTHADRTCWVLTNWHRSLKCFLITTSYLKTLESAYQYWHPCLYCVWSHPPKFWYDRDSYNFHQTLFFWVT